MRLKVFILFLLMSYLSLPQSYRSIQAMATNSEEERVTMSASLPMNQAIQLLSRVCKKFTGKLIIGGEDINAPIGIEITNTNWYKALELISRYNGYEFSETESYLKFYAKTVKQESVPDILKGINFETREVNISAVFFELNVLKSKEIGTNWKFLLSGKDLNLASQLGLIKDQVFLDGTSTSSSSASGTDGTGTGQTEVPSFDLGVKNSFKIGDLLGKATAIFNFFETQQVGEIIASPNITVRDGIKGEIQVGSDYSTREKDFSGNTVERFFSTGTIIKVTPYVLNSDGKNYIYLDLATERSSAIPGQISTEIKRTKAMTNVLLLNGEETVIGGLYINEESNQRSGIPILKDLPWWVLGIRYLTGVDATVVTKKELIIVLKAQMIPSLSERLSMEKGNVIKDQMIKNEEIIKKFQINKEMDKKEESNENKPNNSEPQ